MRNRWLLVYVLGATAAVVMTACTASSLPLSPSSGDRVAAHRQTRNWMKAVDARAPLIYLADFSANNVTVFDRRGTIQGQLGELSNPAGLFVDKRRHLWVANFFARNVLEFARGGTTPIATLNDPAGYPYDVTICPNGTTYVSNISDYGGNNGDIEVYAPGHSDPGEVLTWSDVNHWYYITCDAQNNVFATGSSTASGGGRVIGFPAGGSVGEYDLGITLTAAGGIKANLNGNLLVDDEGNHVISEFTETGVSTGNSIGTGTGDITEIDVFRQNRTVGGADASIYDHEGVTFKFPGGSPRKTYQAAGAIQPLGFAIDPAQK